MPIWRAGAAGGTASLDQSVSAKDWLEVVLPSAKSAYQAKASRAK
jgi:hypothetical protein